MSIYLGDEFCQVIDGTSFFCAFLRARGRGHDYFYYTSRSRAVSLDNTIFKKGCSLQVLPQHPAQYGIATRGTRQAAN